jgi:hypothetical protein
MFSVTTVVYSDMTVEELDVPVGGGHQQVHRDGAMSTSWCLHFSTVGQGFPNFVLGPTLGARFVFCTSTHS